MVQDFRSEVADVNSRDVMELLLITQYFDTLRVSKGSYQATVLRIRDLPWADALVTWMQHAWILC